MPALFFEEPEELIGNRLDATYELTSVLGGGATAVVFSGRHVVLDRPVAVKVLHPTLALLPEMRTRFMREASAAASVDHPNLVRVTDARVSAEGVHYLVMEHLSGQDLTRWASARAPLSLAQIVGIGGQVAEVLEALHQAGLVHRDLKPENIIVLEGGAGAPRIKLIDLGIVAHAGGGDPATRLTRGDVTLGTVFYMSPEQAAGATVDGRSDVYALGCVLWELAVGRPWVGEGSPSEVLARHLSSLPEAPSSHRQELPAWFDALVLKCLAKKPEQRFQSARELAARLVEPSGASADAMRPVFARPAPSAGRWAFTAVAGLLCAALGFGVGRVGWSDGAEVGGGEPSGVAALVVPEGGAAAAETGSDYGSSRLAETAVSAVEGAPVEDTPGELNAGAGLPEPSTNLPTNLPTHSPANSFAGSLASPGLLRNSQGGAADPEPRADERVAARVERPAAKAARAEKPAQVRGAARGDETNARAGASDVRRAKLSFAVEPEGSEVRRNGSLLGRTPLSIEVDASPTTVSYEVSHPSRVTLKLVYPNEVDRVITRSLPRLETDTAVSAANTPPADVERPQPAKPEVPKNDEELWRPSRPGAGP